MSAEKFDWSQVGVKSSAQQPFDWSQVGVNKEDDAQQQLASIQQQHPYLYQLANALKGNKALDVAGNVAGHIVGATEGTGLPSAARGFFGTGIEAGRGIANLIPGVNIQRQELPELNVNPYVGAGAELAGSIPMSLPIFRGYQAAKSGLEAIPYAKEIPSALKNILAGGLTGAAISPDNRKLGFGLGLVAEAIPSAAQKIQSLKPDAFKAIQAGYDQKLKKAVGLIEQTGKEAEKAGLTNIPIRSDLVNEIKNIGPKTKKFASLIDKMKDGDYQSMRKVQSELFTRAEKLKASDFVSDRDQGDLIHELRDEMNQSIANHFEKSGRKDLAQQLKRGMGQYKNIIETYHSVPQIAKLVGKSKEIPSTTNILKKQSTEMEQLRMHHPEIAKQLDYEKKLRIGQGLVGLTGAGALIKKAMDLYKD